MLNKEDNYSLAELTVYKYMDSKVKCDYSIIPVKWMSTINESFFQSEVSNEKISTEGFKLSKNPFCLPPDLIKFEKSKEGDACKIYIVSEGSIENVESRTIKKLYKEFRKHFWYKFKYKSFLEKKKNMRQINF